MKYHMFHQMFAINIARGISTSLRKMPIKAALIDLSGTLHIDDEETPGAVNALKELRSTGIHIKFVTNTTKESKNTLYNRLIHIGFELEKGEIYSSLSATNRYVCENKLNPIYLVSEDARQDFPPATEKPFDSVVVGLAPEAFNYEKLNEAFRVLLENKESELIAIHQGKYYKRKDGLALGPGCFIKGLEYATSKEPKIIGKPNKYFFESAIPKGLSPEECVMIGDDVNDDIVGALKNNIRGIQVKTGKYLPDVAAELPPTVLVENFAEAVAWIKTNLNL